MKNMTSIKIKSGLNEFKEFLKEKNINFQIRIQEAFDVGIIIELIGISVGIINILLELKKWLSKNKKEKQVILIINNTQINLNLDSEEEIKGKLK
ncbi:MAG: hypothetical protein ABIE94_04740 [archaeon]